MEVPASTTKLTPRQKETLALVVAGASNKQIASELGVSEETVKRHLYDIFNKRGYESRSHLISSILGKRIRKLELELETIRSLSPREARIEGLKSASDSILAMISRIEAEQGFTVHK